MSEAWDKLVGGKPRHVQLQAGWKCPLCGLCRKRDNGPDPCLGELPGVDYACCGHGGMGNSPGYISFSNGTTVRFSMCTVDVDGVNSEFKA